MNLRYGIFGGTFDPPHIGHLILAEEAIFQLHLDKVLWVLTPDPPHKRDREITAVKSRESLVRAAIADCPKFSFSEIDMKRPPPHYAVDTVHLLQAAHPEVNLVYLMGGDSLRDLPKWYAAEAFVDACHALGVMRRPGDEVSLEVLGGKIPGVREKIQFVDAPMLEISASQVRSRIRAGRPFRHFLPDAVYTIIVKESLY